jgi:hypothetical protein
MNWLIFGMLLVAVFLMLNGRKQGRILRFLISAFYIVFPFICLFILAFIVQGFAQADTFSKTASPFFHFGITKMVDAQMKAGSTAMVLVWVPLMIPTLIIDIILTMFAMSLSLKFPVMTGALVIWAVWTAWVTSVILKPMYDQAELEDEKSKDDPYSGMSHEEQVFAMVHAKVRKDKAEAARKAEAEAAAEAAARAAEIERSKPKLNPYTGRPEVPIRNKYPGPGAFKL